jgi:hypothetical protein
MGSRWPFGVFYMFLLCNRALFSGLRLALRLPFRFMSSSERTIPVSLGNVVR